MESDHFQRIDFHRTGYPRRPIVIAGLGSEIDQDRIGMLFGASNERRGIGASRRRPTRDHGKHVTIKIHGGCRVSHTPGISVSDLSKAVPQGFPPIRFSDHGSTGETKIKMARSNTFERTGLSGEGWGPEQQTRRRRIVYRRASEREYGGPDCYQDARRPGPADSTGIAHHPSPSPGITSCR